MPRPKATEPTGKHLNILRVIMDITRESGPPLVIDIVRKLGYASIGSLSRTLEIMAGMDLIETVKRGRGKIVLATQKGREAIGIRGIPLSGAIPAGILSEILGTGVEYVELEDLVPYKRGDFLLKVEGESMIDAGILPGDMVLIRPNVEPRQGEIAAVQVGDERRATLKRVYLDRTKKEVRLEASNPAFPNQIVRDEEVRIAGVFQTLVRHSNGFNISTP